MSFVIADRVRETTQTTGTGSVALQGALGGYKSFSTIGDGNSTYYVIVLGSQWEVGIGTYTASNNTLARTTVLSSSNNDNLVNFAVGVKDVVLTQPAERAVYVDGTNIVAANGATLPNASTTATSANTASAIVARDGSGNFSAGTITAALSGNATTATSATSATTAGNVTGVVAFANGGTGQTTQQAAINALVGTQTANRVLRSNGTNMSLAQVALATDVSGTLPVANGGTGQTSFTNGQLLIGNTTGNTLTKATLTAGCGVTITNGSGSITISAAGGSVCPATPTTEGIVFGRTDVLCCGGKTALGGNAGGCSQGSFSTAIGACSQSACFGVAVGQTSFAGLYGVAIGNCTTTCTFGVAIGFNACASGGVSVGRNSVSATGGVSIGWFASTNINAVAIGPNTNTTGNSQTHIGPIRCVCSTSGLQGLFYNACTREVIRGTAGGGGGSPATPTVAGVVFGQTSPPCINGAVSLGFATTAGSSSVSIGTSAYSCNYSVAVGDAAGAYASFSTALGIGTTASFGYQTHIGPIRSATGPYTLYYCPCSREITYN